MCDEAVGVSGALIWIADRDSCPVCVRSRE